MATAYEMRSGEITVTMRAQNRAMEPLSEVLLTPGFLRDIPPMKFRSSAISLPTKWPSFACRFASTSVKEVLFDRILFHPQRRGKNKKMVKNMKNEMKNENRDDLGAIGIGQ